MNGKYKLALKCEMGYEGRVLGSRRVLKRSWGGDLNIIRR